MKNVSDGQITNQITSTEVQITNHLQK